MPFGIKEIISGGKQMESEKLKLSSKDVLIEDAISKAISKPGVRVDRNEFLTRVFSSRVADIQKILDVGPVEAGIPREELADIAHKMIISQTGSSSIAPVKALIPGKTESEVMQVSESENFFASAMRIAQELSYIYGAKDMWVDGGFDNEKVKTQLMIYFGVMLGVSGAASAVRVITAALAKTAFKVSPVKILKRLFGKSFFKKALGSGIAKSAVTQAVPLVSGAISGGINYAAVVPMAKKLLTALDEAAFDYTEEEFASDIAVIESMADEETPANTETTYTDGKKHLLAGKLKKLPAPKGITGKGKKKKADGENDSFEQVKKYKELLDLGIISEEEFEQKKKELLNL